LKLHAFEFRSDVLDQHAVVQIVQALSLQIGFLVTFHGDSVLVKGMFVSLIARNGIPVIEVNVKLPGLAADALQFHINALHIALPPVHDVKAKPHHPLVAIVAIEITAIQTEPREVRLVGVVQIVQRMNAVNLFGTAFPELQMKVRILRVFLTHRPDDVALPHLCTWDHTLCDAVEMEIDKKQVILSIRRIDDFETNMG
jgi:hypothetical protein